MNLFLILTSILIVASVLIISSVFELQDALAEESTTSNSNAEPQVLISPCEKKHEPYDPNVPLERGEPLGIRIVDVEGNTRSSVNLNEKTFLTYGISNEDSSRCLMEIEIFVYHYENDGKEKLVSYEKIKEKFLPHQGKQIPGTFTPSLEGEYLVIFDPKGFPPSEISFFVFESPSAKINYIKKLPPLKQIQKGILPIDVSCKQNFELILKSPDHSSACVKPSTAEILVKRGWIQPELFFLVPNPNEKEYEVKPREWQTSGPFQIDRREYALGEKIFLKIDGLSLEEKGQITVMRPLNITHYSVYVTIPFDGANKDAFNYYIDPQLSKTRGLCSVDDVLGKWALVFRGTNYSNLNFEIIESIVPGTDWNPVC